MKTEDKEITIMFVDGDVVTYTGRVNYDCNLEMFTIYRVGDKDPIAYLPREGIKVLEYAG